MPFIVLHGTGEAAQHGAATDRRRRRLSAQSVRRTICREAGRQDPATFGFSDEANLDVGATWPTTSR
jgi:hypothetical protein